MTEPKRQKIEIKLAVVDLDDQNIEGVRSELDRLEKLYPEYDELKFKWEYPDSWSDYRMSVLYGVRDETDDEQTKRLEDAAAVQSQQVARERKQYEYLKKKFGNIG